MSVGIKPGSSERASSALNCQAIAPAAASSRYIAQDCVPRGGTAGYTDKSCLQKQKKTKNGVSTGAHWGPEEGRCEPPDVGLGTKLGPLEGQQVLLTVSSPLVWFETRPQQQQHAMRSPLNSRTEQQVTPDLYTYS